jgi:adenylate cyclase
LPIPSAGWREIFRAPGRAIALVILGLLVLVRARNPAFLETLVLHGFDLEQQIAPRAYQPLPVRIVAIDEKSLSKYGQWPWPRTLVAKLVQQIAAGHPHVLGVDIIFAESDRVSPQKLVQARPDLPAPLAHELSLLPSNEVALAEAFSQVPTVLGVGSSDVPEPAARGPSRITIIRETGGDPRPFLTTYPYLLRSLPELTAAARGQAAVLDSPDPDGMTRRLPLFVVGHGQLLPTLSLEMLRVASGAGTLEILTVNDGVRGGSVDGVFIPTDAHGRVYPYFTPSYEIRYVSAADLLDGSYDPAALRSGIVFLGVTGQGLIDEQQTPLGLMAGLEVHAQLLECIIDGNFLRRPAKLDWIEIVLILAAGLITIFALPYSLPRIATAGLVILVALLVGSAFGSFLFFNLLVDAICPSMAALATFGVMLAATLRAAELDLQREREVEARFEGELGAARSIQMGLLPHRFPGPPENREVDLYALIEPARMVGGDFYDFLLLDSQRLFFAIADVSGKGVPAALFMAMTKEVLRDTLTRHDEDLGKAFTEASARISASSGDMADAGGDMMFVTVFAGILNLVSGMLASVNAGHDSPLLIRAGAKANELAGEGGPPLGTVDDFPYAVEHHQLMPGDLLLLYTDGVTEAEDRNDAFYTEARLGLLLQSAPTASAKALVEFVSKDVRRFAADAEQADDITLLAVRWTGAEPAAG